MKSMVLLGINCGFGNGDVASLPLKALDLKSGWVRFPRPKTGIDRRIPLWPETIDALKAAQDQRPDPLFPADKPLFFVTPLGNAYTSDGIGREIRSLLDTANVTRQGLTFYALRHTFQTVAEGARDLPAVRVIMGHADSDHDMSARYRDRVEDERLLAVVEHVRGWLFGVEIQGGTK